MPRTRYTREEKEDALRLCDEMGVSKASEQTGISANSLYKWRTDAEEDETSRIAVEEGAASEEDANANGSEASPNEENDIPSRKRYTAEEKKDALRLCDEMGITQASKATGITVNSIRKWRADARNEAPVASSADETSAQEAAVERSDPQMEEASESTAIIARLRAPAEDTAPEETNQRQPCDNANAHKPAADEGIPDKKPEKTELASPARGETEDASAVMSGELIRLQTENEMLKAQILVLKSALRVFAQ